VSLIGALAAAGERHCNLVRSSRRGALHKSLLLIYYVASLSIDPTPYKHHQQTRMDSCTPPHLFALSIFFDQRGRQHRRCHRTKATYDLLLLIIILHLTHHHQLTNQPRSLDSIDQAPCFAIASSPLCSRRDHSVAPSFSPPLSVAYSLLSLS
jgi:hypothetical protein